MDSDLLKYNLKDRKFLCIDIETCEGLNLFYNRPHQISWALYNGSYKTESYNFYLKWDKPFIICERAAQVCKYDPKIIEKEGKDPKECLSLLHKYLYNEKYWIVGSNVLSFDVMIIYNSFKKVGLECDYSFISRVYDVNALFKLWKRGIKIDNKNLLSQQFSSNNFVQRGLKSNVEYMAKEFGIEVNSERLHQSDYDIDVEAKIFFELIKRIEIK